MIPSMNKIIIVCLAATFLLAAGAAAVSSLLKATRDERNEEPSRDSSVETKIEVNSRCHAKYYCFTTESHVF